MSTLAYRVRKIQADIHAKLNAVKIDPQFIAMSAAAGAAAYTKNITCAPAADAAYMILLSKCFDTMPNSTNTERTAHSIAMSKAWTDAFLTAQSKVANAALGNLVCV